MQVTLLLAITSLPLLVTSHVILENPAPYTFADYGPSNPLLPDGSDFPCKVPPGKKLEAAGPPTKISIGGQNTLSFTGDAVHGGGSCQLSLTKDFPPTKDSDWAVIHSIEGGCPARNQEGNLPEGGKPDDFEYTVPEGVEPGEYVFAWTWVNRIGGQPEYYMNCAPVEVVSGPTTKRSPVVERRSRYSPQSEKRALELPAMFVANIGEAGNGCTTESARQVQIAIKYPDAGDPVDKANGEDTELFEVECDGSHNAGKRITLSGGSVSSGNTSPQSGNSQSAQPQSPTAASIPSRPQSTGPVGYGNTQPSAVSSPEPYTPTEPETSSPSADYGSHSGNDSDQEEEYSEEQDSEDDSEEHVSGNNGSENYGSGNNGSGEHSSGENGCEQGSFKCIDGTTLSICTGGIWTPAQPLGGETKCEEGISDTLQIIDPYAQGGRGGRNQYE